MLLYIHIYIYTIYIYRHPESLCECFVWKLKGVQIVEPESHENILNAVNAVSAASNALAAVGGLGAGALAVAMDEGIAAVGGDSVVRLEMVLVMQTTLSCKIACTGNLCRTCSFHSNHSYCSWFSAIAKVLIVACLLLHKLELRPSYMPKLQGFLQVMEVAWEMSHFRTKWEMLDGNAQ